MRQKIRTIAKILIMTMCFFCAAQFPSTAASPAPSTIHSVAISPGSAVVAKGTACTFTASVTGENDYSSEVVWSVSGQSSQSTFIDSKGVLNVAADEGAANLVVKAVSKQDSAYSATALAVIQNATYRVNISVNDANGGTATESQTVNAGEKLTVKATPKEGWRFVEWRENDKGIGSNQEMTLENITGDRNLTAVFEKEAPKTYTVTASVSSAGGIITPTGASPVPVGSWIGYAITPNQGYRVRMVYVDGAAVGAATSYNFTDVHGDHTISAEFEPDPAQAQTNRNGQNQPDSGADKNQTISDDPEKPDADKAGQAGSKQDSAQKTDKTPDKDEEDAALQRKKEAEAAKAEREKIEREKMEQERMEKEKAEAEAERAQRVESEKKRLEQEKAEAEKALAEQKAAKERQRWIVFGIVAALVAACALGVFLVMKKRRG